MLERLYARRAAPIIFIRCGRRPRHDSYIKELEMVVSDENSLDQ